MMRRREKRANPIPEYITIQDPHDPHLVAYRSLRGKELEREGIFIAEGYKVVKSMMESECRVASCLTSEEAIGRYEALVKTMVKRGASAYVAANRLIENIVGFRFHKGIMAVGYCPKKLKTTEALKEPRRPLFLVAFNAVNDPQNVGLIARNAAAFGVQALIVDNATYDPYYRKAIRVSMGTIFRLPVYYDYDLKESLSWLKKRYNMRIIAAACGMDSEVIAGTKLSGSVCIVFGNEDKGISREILDIADAKVRIPVSRNVDSLNVACASAVCLYEASRRRRKGHSLIRVTH